MINPNEAKYAKGVVVTLPYPTDDVRLLTRAAVDALDHIFQPGFKYSKAEVLLLDLRQPGEFSDDLFAVNQPAEASRVVGVLDEINGRWGRGYSACCKCAEKSRLGNEEGDNESELHNADAATLAGVL